MRNFKKKLPWTAFAAMQLFLMATPTVFSASGTPASNDGPSITFPDLDSCVRDKRCWRLIETGFSFLFPIHLGEVEGAPKGQFFPGAITFTKRKMDSEGHFIDVFCVDQGGHRSVCTDKRDILEERVVSMTLLSALPIKSTEGLYDPRTWETTSLGKQYIQKARNSFPGLWGRLFGLVVKAINV